MRGSAPLTLYALLATASPALGQGTLIVGNKGEDTLSFIDLATGREHRRVPTGRMPHEVAVSPRGDLAAVVAYGGRTIELFDLATGRRVGAIDLGENARSHGMLWLRHGRIVATMEGRAALAIVPVQEPDSAAPREPADVVGPVCESGDFLALDRALPPLRRGDLIAIRGAGAYAATMASHYNARPFAPEVLVEDGRALLIRKREPLESLWRDETLL